MKGALGLALTLWCVTPALGVTIVDVNLYEAGTTNGSTCTDPGGTVDVDVVVTLRDGTEALTGYEMDIIDSPDDGFTTKGISIQSILDRVIVPTGWADLSLSSYPVELWNTALDAAAYSTNAAYDLASGASYVVETLTLKVPDDGGGPYHVTVDPDDAGLLFTGPGGAELGVGVLTGISICPEPTTSLLLVLGMIGLLRRRR
jgi:hypothetical protein